MAELSVRYATALFELSTENGLLNEYLEQAVFLRDMLKSGEFSSIIKHPDIPAADKRDFLNDAFAGNIHNDLLGFLHLTIAKNRESFLVPALTEFISMGDSYNKKTTAQVVSAARLDKSQISALKSVLSKKLNKQVEVTSKIDPSVIGGLYIHVDGYFVDRTVKTQLNDMKDTIRRSTPNDFQA